MTQRARLYALGAGLLAFVAFFVRFQAVKAQRDRAVERAKKEKARADQAQKVIAADAEIENEFSDLKREADRAIKAGEMPEHIRNRNVH